MKKTLTALFVAAFAFATYAVPLKLEVPQAQLSGTPVPINVANLDKSENPTPDVPADVKNIAKGKKVTSSDDMPYLGEPKLVTDGDKLSEDDHYVQFSEGLQWVQIDLDKSAEIFAIAVWHFHSQERVYNDVIIQVSDDPEFIKSVTTIYNNDSDNSAKKGVGKDKPYIDNNKGRLFVAKTPVKARYVRLYSNGNTSNELNEYIEVEVFGR